jgi:plastocyanin
MTRQHQSSLTKQPETIHSTNDQLVRSQLPKPKAALVILLLLILGTGWWLYANRADIASESDPMEVLITANGFEPGTVLIKSGTEVMWINADSEPHRVTSNPHPEGDDLPGLDSVEPLGPGASYSYTFEQSGSYGYHDYYNPETNGVVEVE